MKKPGKIEREEGGRERERFFLGWKSLLPPSAVGNPFLVVTKMDVATNNPGVNQPR